MATPPTHTRADGEQEGTNDRHAVIEEFVPEPPKEELREVVRGETPRTPFSLIGGMSVVILGFAALVTGIVVLAMWLV